MARIRACGATSPLSLASTDLPLSRFHGCLALECMARRAATDEMPVPFNAMIRSNPMKTKLVLGAVAAAVAVFSQGAFAQSASSPTRADVKAETKAANKSGQ